MLKKVAALVVLAAAPLSSAFADADVGCGAGTKIWAGQNGTPYKVLASTTNGLFGNQTFGISSGTLGCHQNGTVTAEARVPMFASANLDALSADMAAGKGESLAALASLYNIAEADRAGFYALTKTHYGEIFASARTTSDQMVASLKAVMKADARYAQYVS